MDGMQRLKIEKLNIGGNKVLVNGYMEVDFENEKEADEFIIKFMLAWEKEFNP